MTTTEATALKPYREISLASSRIWFDDRPGAVSMAHADIRDGKGEHTVMALAVPPPQHLPTLFAQARKLHRAHGALRGMYYVHEAWFLPLEHQNAETGAQDWSKDPRAYEIMGLTLADEAGLVRFHARITNYRDAARTLGPWVPLEGAPGAHPLASSWALWGRK